MTSDTVLEFVDLLLLLPWLCFCVEESAAAPQCPRIFPPFAMCRVLLALVATVLLCGAQFVPPDPRDCGKGISCFPCQPQASRAVPPPDCSSPAQRRNATCQSNSIHKLAAATND